MLVSATKENGYGDGVTPASCMTAWRLAKPVVPGSCKSRRAGASTRSSSDELLVEAPALRDLHEPGTTGFASLQAVMHEAGITPSP